ncbi:hypothetical protein DFP94_1011424 [Fontibacillus phaseoli]|uniref:Uncharacterized protein n=1 Tax=Fontibacillus phaseoli TaxID=1416533 RepID=A0A369BQB7_9BACL|nr:hypothetical protein [Fontibacillus phaseoli]RCX23820.1 hypothetical protein DFP94_1011424 [Fontibacillus phaseoli]
MNNIWFVDEYLMKSKESELQLATRQARLTPAINRTGLLSLSALISGRRETSPVQACCVPCC